MTLPNAISLARIAGVPAFVVLLYADVPRSLPAVAFALLAATDSLDGWLARSRNAVTVFGKFVDPLADKLLVSCALIALVDQGQIAGWIAMIVIAREFAVTGLRLVAARAEVIAASWLGKAKAFAQNVAIVAVILDTDLDEIENALVAIAVVLTVWSAVDYFWKSRRHLELGRQGGAG